MPSTINPDGSITVTPQDPTDQTAIAAQVAALQQEYITATQQLCGLCGQPIVNILLREQAAQYVQSQIGTANEGFALGLGIELTNLEGKLVALQGPQALNAIT